MFTLNHPPTPAQQEKKTRCLIPSFHPGAVSLSGSLFAVLKTQAMPGAAPWKDPVGWGMEKLFPQRQFNSALGLRPIFAHVLWERWAWVLFQLLPDPQGSSLLHAVFIYKNWHTVCDEGNNGDVWAFIKAGVASLRSVLTGIATIAL